MGVAGPTQEQGHKSGMWVKQSCPSKPCNSVSPYMSLAPPEFAQISSRVFQDCNMGSVWPLPVYFSTRYELAGVGLQEIGSVGLMHLPKLMLYEAGEVPGPGKMTFVDNRGTLAVVPSAISPKSRNPMTSGPTKPLSLC